MWVLWESARLGLNKSRQERSSLTRTFYRKNRATSFKVLDCKCQRSFTHLESTVIFLLPFHIIFALLKKTWFYLWKKWNKTEKQKRNWGTVILMEHPNFCSSEDQWSLNKSGKQKKNPKQTMTTAPDWLLCWGRSGAAWPTTFCFCDLQTVIHCTTQLCRCVCLKIRVWVTLQPHNAQTRISQGENWPVSHTRTHTQWSLTKCSRLCKFYLHFIFRML